MECKYCGDPEEMCEVLDTRLGMSCCRKCANDPCAHDGHAPGCQCAACDEDD